MIIAELETSGIGTLILQGINLQIAANPCAHSRIQIICYVVTLWHIRCTRPVHVLPISLAFALALSIEHLSADCLLEQDLAESYADADELAHEAYNLYSKFRPQIPEGQAGWGKKGLLDLQQIKELHKS